ncbi:MAG: signal peptidase I [Ruminococcaceae bacterium]|nr:signal peptidase I [Oscillospiraceae bacterium]
MQENKQKSLSGEEQTLPQPYVMTGSKKVFAEFFEILEMLASVTICVMLCFAFVARLNIVDGHSMDQTLADKQYLVVSDAFYTPAAGDIVVIHDVTAAPYDSPIVKRVIATEGQEVVIDFTTWTLTVDGEVMEEPYRFIDHTLPLLTANYNVDENNVFTLTVPEGEIFVMGDNRNGSGDSRQRALGTVDERCVVGRAYFRLFPLDTFGKLW